MLSIKTLKFMFLCWKSCIPLFLNNGIHNFQQRSIKYNVLIDSTGQQKKIPIIINISNPSSDDEYQIKKINQIDIYVETLDELSSINSYTDSLSYNGINIFSKGKLNYSPKSLTEPIFFNIDEIYSEKNKVLTSRYFSNLGNFKYPRIVMTENENDLNEVIEYIRQPVSGTKFFNPVTEF